MCHDAHNFWTYSCDTKEAIGKSEGIFGPSPKKITPLPSSEYHPEIDTSELLNIKENKKYQVILGMLQWNYTIG